MRRKKKTEWERVDQWALSSVLMQCGGLCMLAFALAAVILCHGGFKVLVPLCFVCAFGLAFGFGNYAKRRGAAIAKRLELAGISAY